MVVVIDEEMAERAASSGWSYYIHCQFICLDLDALARKLLTILAKDPIEPSQLGDVRPDGYLVNRLRDRVDGGERRRDGCKRHKRELKVLCLVPMLWKSMALSKK